MVFFALLILFACGLLSSAVAQSKNRSASSWFWCGVTCGPLGLLAACGMEPLPYTPKPLPANLQQDLERKLKPIGE